LASGLSYKSSQNTLFVAVCLRAAVQLELN
jgi:hypothetical protein